jgi:hypothetical protein
MFSKFLGVTMIILYECGERFSKRFNVFRFFSIFFSIFFRYFSIFSIGLYIGQRSGGLFRFAAGTFGHELLEQLVLPLLMQPGVQPFPRHYAVFRNFPERSFLLGKTVEVVWSFHTAIFSARCKLHERVRSNWATMFLDVPGDNRRSSSDNHRPDSP